MKSALMPREDLLPSALARKAAVKGWLKWVVLFSASLSALLEVIDVSIVNVAIPDMQGNLGASLSEIGWVSTSYTMANVVIIPLTAWLGSRFGKKRYFIFSLVSFTVASAVCGLAPNLATLIFARVLQGLGGGGLLAKGQAILFETFPPAEHAKASALFGLGIIGGPTFGPALGGFLTDTMGWRWIFFINIPVGIFAIWMCSTFLLNDEETQRTQEQPVDWWGITLLTLGLASLQVILEQGHQEDWFESALIRRMAVLSVVALMLFVWQELRTSHPAVDLKLLKNRSLAAGSLYSITLGIGLYGTIFVIPIFVQRMLHFNPTQTGLLLIPGAMASAVAMILMGRFARRFDARLLIGIGSGVMILAMYQISGINSDTGEDQLFWPLIIRGLGIPMMFIPLSIATLGGLEKKDVAAGSGFYSLTRQLGGSLGIALLTTLVEKMQGVYRGVLVEHIHEFNSAVAERLSFAQSFLKTTTSDPVRWVQQSWALIDSAVQLQSMILSFANVFRVVGLIFLVSLPLLFLLSRGGSEIDPSSEH